MKKHMLRKTYGGDIESHLYDTEVYQPQAAFACELLRVLAMPNGVPDGIDGKGDVQVRLLTPKEAVSRACEIAALAFDEYKSRGWTLEVPAPILSAGNIP
jgi:hypothetical protein